MIAKNKIISSTIIGLIVGFVLALLLNSEQANMLTLAPFGGIVGFLVGWIRQARSGEAEQ